MGDRSRHWSKQRWPQTPANSPASSTEDRRCYNIRITSKADTPMSPSPEPMRRTVTFTDYTESCPRTPHSVTNEEIENVLNMESEERKAVASMLASWPQPPIQRPKNIPLCKPPNSPSAASTEGYSENGLTPEKLGRVSRWLKDASEALHDPVWRPRESDHIPQKSMVPPTSCVALTAAPSYLNGSQGFVPQMNQMPYQPSHVYPQAQYTDAHQQYPTYPPPPYGYLGSYNAQPAFHYGNYQQSRPHTQVVNSHFRPISTPIPTYSQPAINTPETLTQEQLEETFTCPNCLHKCWFVDNKTLIPIVPRVNRQATETCTGSNALYSPQPIRPMVDPILPPQPAFQLIPQIQFPDTSLPPPGYIPTGGSQHNIAAVMPQPQSNPGSVAPPNRKRPYGVYDTTVRKLTFSPNPQ